MDDPTDASNGDFRCIRPDTLTRIVVRTDNGVDEYRYLTVEGHRFLDPVEDTSPASAFDDVPADAWYAQAVEYVTDRGLMNGTGAGFEPNGVVTRGQIMTVLARLDGADTEGGEPWYQKGLEWAVSNGISDGSNPTKSVTRQELVVMLWRYAGEPRSSQNLDGFIDASSVDDWAVDAMRWASEVGLIGGDAEGRIMPKATAFRSVIATVFMRYCQIDQSYGGAHGNGLN